MQKEPPPICRGKVYGEGGPGWGAGDRAEEDTLNEGRTYEHQKPPRRLRRYPA